MDELNEELNKKNNQLINEPAETKDNTNMINIKYEENKINELNILERQYMMKKEQFNNIINQKDEKINVL